MCSAENNNKEKYSRRVFTKTMALAGAGALAFPLTSCEFDGGGKFRINSGVSRSFGVRPPFKFAGGGVVASLAFKVFNPQIKNLFDYADFHCPKCAFAMRVFLYAFNIASAATTIACPYCSFATRIGLLAGSYLASNLIDYGFDQGIAFLQGREFKVNQIAPTYLSNYQIKTGRSKMCFDILRNEPNGIINREISYVPQELFYFTDIRGFNWSSHIFHNWYRNGRQVDHIRLDIKSSRYRTYSKKRVLDRGEWIVTTEAPNGHILDAKEFSIT